MEPEQQAKILARRGLEDNKAHKRMQEQKLKPHGLRDGGAKQGMIRKVR